MSFRPRFENGAYRDCRWCGGAGCLSCGPEAEKAYKREFPNGAQPIATFDTSKLGEQGTMDLLKSLLGAEAIESAYNEADKRASKIVDENRVVARIAGCTPEEAKHALTASFGPEVLIENIVRAASQAGVSAQREKGAE